MADEDAALERARGQRATRLALEEQQRSVKSKLRAASNSLRELGAVANGYDDAYMLVPPPPEYPHENTVHDRLFRLKKTRLDPALVRKLNISRFADFDAADAVRSQWKISALGLVKCEAVWKLFDADEDGVWDYEEFLEYVTALESGCSESYPRTRRPAFVGSHEMWRMYMCDLYELDRRQQLTFDGFVQYREDLEDNHPLAHDLKLLGISLEWPELEHLRALKRLFGEYSGQDNSVELKQALFMLHESGRTTTYQELCMAVQRQRYLFRCLRSIRQRKCALRLFGYRQQPALEFTNPVVEEEPRICKTGFLSLVLSSWIPAQQTRWRQLFLQTRLSVFSTIRRWKRDVSWAFNWIRLASRTGLLRASCLVSNEEADRGDYVLKMDVGPNFTTRATVHLTYNSDADSASTLHELKYLERGAECFIYFDFTCRQGIRENDIQTLVQRLTWFINEFFREQLEMLPFFHKWFLTIPTKLQLRSGPSTPASGSAIVRLVILFSGDMDLYQVMQSLNLPSSMQFDHLLQRLSFRWLSSHSLEDMLMNKRFLLGSHWACRSQCDVRMSRHAWAQILKQWAQQMEYAKARDEEDREYADYLKRQDALQKEQERTLRRRATGFKKGRASLAFTSNNNQEEFSRKKRERKDAEPGGALYWVKLAAQALDASQDISSTWSFPSLTDLLLDHSWLASALSPARFEYLRHLLSSTGAVASEWKLGGDSFRAEFAATRYAQTAASRGGGGSGVTRMFSRVSSRSSLLDESLQSTSVASSFPFASPAPTPETSRRGGRSEYQGGTARSTARSVDDNSSRPEMTKEEQLENDLLELYDACCKILLGLRVVRAEAGTSGLTCVLDGWNIFGLLPHVYQSAASAKRSSFVRTKSSVSTSSKR